MTLQKFMSEHALLLHGWGQVDCSLSLADWAMWLGFDDCATHLRGTYSTLEECQALVASKGGLVNVIQGCCDLIEWERVAVQGVGSVAVIGSETNAARQWGAIWNGRNWCVRDPSGWVSFHARPLAIWDF